jgi:thiamine biosynthesis lipoprotein
MFSKTFDCMGTVFTFQIGGERDSGQTASDVETACSILVDADNRFSLYKDQSEISQIARGDLSWDASSAVQKEIRAQTENWKVATEGFFNSVSPDGTYDPSGLVKTWAAKNAAMYLEANGYRDFTLNAGGDVYIGPEVKTFPLTRVGLSNLKPINSPGASVNMILDVAGTKYRGIATSGSTERGEHIWLSSEASKTKQFLQVTVVATDLVTADIWATAIISGGQQAFELFEGKVKSEVAVAVATSHDGRIHSSTGFASILANLG